MKWLALAVTLAAVMPVAAEEIKKDDSLASVYYSFKTSNGDGFNMREVFRMMPGGCLRGPLWFKDNEGKIAFELKDGVEYPTGCGKR